MHLKRSKIPKKWPLPRKGTRYVVMPSHGMKNSIPLLIVLRDMLKLVRTRREAKKLINLKKIKVNEKLVRDEKLGLSLFDNINLDNRNFKLILENKKFKIEGGKSDGKIAKIIGKKIMKKGKIQVNLNDGRNYITDKKVKVGDSALISLKENKISEILELKKGSRVMLISGKHMGGVGIIDEVNEEHKMVNIKIEDSKINAKIKNLMVIK